MSLSIKWKCDICDDQKPKEEMIAVVFSQLVKPFKLIPFGDSGFRDHQGKHICKDCIKGIRP